MAQRNTGGWHIAVYLLFTDLTQQPNIIKCHLDIIHIKVVAA